MRIIGVDADSKLFAAVALDDTPEPGQPIFQWVLHQEKGRIAEDRFFGLMDAFEKFIRSEFFYAPGAWPSAVYIEAPVAGRNIAALRSQAYIIGAMRQALKRNGLHSYLVDNTTWKKQVIGSGKATKDDIALFAIQQWGQRGLEQDVYDAACIAQFGRIARL